MKDKKLGNFHWKGRFTNISWQPLTGKSFQEILIPEVFLHYEETPCVFPSAATTELSTRSIRTCIASTMGQYGKIYPSCQTNTENQHFQYYPARKDNNKI